MSVRKILRVGLLVVFAGSMFAGELPPSMRAARELLESGSIDAAEREFKKVNGADAEGAEASFWLGEIALLRNDPEKAIAAFERAVALAPSNSRYHHRLGDAFGRAAQNASIFSALGLARKCMGAFQRAVALDPANLDARYSLFLFFCNAPRIIGGGADKALAEALAIRAADPDRGRVALAALYVSQKKVEAARGELAGIVAVDLADTRSDHVSLSDVKWLSADVAMGEPVRNHHWFDVKDQGEIVLLVHGRLYAKGLAARTPSRYAYQLAGAWRTFTATVGLQDGSKEEESAVFVLRGDGRELFRSRPLRVDESQRVKVDVGGVSHLELVAEVNGAHTRQTKAVWADPTLRR